MVFVLILALALLCAAADVSEIVRRAAAILKADWDIAPEYAFTEREEFVRDGKPASKTHQVLMIAGSEYYMPVAMDDRPLSPEQRHTELQRLQQEIRRSNSEEPAAREKRVGNYANIPPRHLKHGSLPFAWPAGQDYKLGRAGFYGTGRHGSWRAGC